MKKALFGLLGIMLTATFTPSAAKAEIGGWSLAVTPYLWAAGIDGTIRVKGYEADVDKPFDEIIKDLDIAAMINLQARKGSFGAYTDIMFVGQSDSAQVTSSAGVPVLDATASIDQLMIDLGASWAVAQWGAAGADSKGFLDLFLGGRYWNFATTASTDNLVNGAFRSVKETRDWIDPIVGARVAADLTPKLQLVGRGDVGGFDLGGSVSKLTWSASAYLGWHFTPLLSAYAGWKYLTVEREDDDGKTLELAESGPVLGLAFTF